jgi:hypothetical protein
MILAPPHKTAGFSEERTMKVKRILVSPEIITTMLTTGYALKGEITVVEGLPEGAVLTAVGWDATSRFWALDFSHEKFEWVDEAKIPPIIKVSIQKTNPVLSDAISE